MWFHNFMLCFYRHRFRSWSLFSPPHLYRNDSHPKKKKIKEKLYSNIIACASTFFFFFHLSSVKILANMTDIWKTMSGIEFSFLSPFKFPFNYSFYIILEEGSGFHLNLFLPLKKKREKKRNLWKDLKSKWSRADSQDVKPYTTLLYI